jgi:hypothetical protein
MQSTTWCAGTDRMVLRVLSLAISKVAGWLGGWGICVASYTVCAWSSQCVGHWRMESAAGYLPGINLDQHDDTDM